MYIKLGSTKINYSNQSTNDYIILAQVIDSSLSFEKPVLVRNIKQLDIWFGTEFEERNYLKELLEIGVTLLLYKPISPESIQLIDGYIDLDNCHKIIVEGDFDEVSHPIDKTIYVVKNKEYIYLKDYSFILVDDLPQNQVVNNTISLCNRDTLSIFEFNKNDKTEIGYISPKYEESEGNLVVDDSCKINTQILDYERLQKGYQTVSSSWSLKFDDNFGKLFPPNYDYFKVGDTAIYISPARMLILPDFPVASRKFNIVINPDDVLEDRISNFKQSMVSFGYRFVDNILIECNEDNTYDIIDLQDFYSSNIINHTSGLFISPVDDYQYLSSLVYNTAKNDEIISFYSKTIGTSDLVDGNISVEIENLNSSDLYRITISRFGFSEIFEGSIEGSIDNVDLKELISNQSNLVYCKTNTDRGYFRFNKNSESWEKINDFLSIEDTKKARIIYDLSSKNHKDGDIAIYRKKLPTGSWQLCGAKIENSTAEYYKKSLTTLLKSSEIIYPDFLLIPDITKYGESVDDNDGTYNIYKTILNLSKEIDCQVLIHNNPIEEIKEISGDFEIKGQSQYNYIRDSENRLIYFYDNIWIYGEKRPGYYIYLKNLLLNDSYSPNTSELLYNPPVKDPYLRHFTEDKKGDAIENYLKKYKTNYLVSNNQIYYYKEFQNGNNFSMSGWMRFCISRINKELIKNKWVIMEEKNERKIKKTVEGILNNITRSFSMIRNINLSEFNVDFNKRTIDITIDTRISDLFNNQLTIDITLNYNSKNKI